MCGISGVYCLDNKKLSSLPEIARDIFKEKFYTILHGICLKTSERGRDSWGIFGYELNGTSPIYLTKDGKYSYQSMAEIGTEKILHSAIFNFRGEPTTEIVDRSTLNIQPFVYKNKDGIFSVAHNGIIPNDKDILGEKQVVKYVRQLGNTGHIIDSYALLQLAEDNWDATTESLDLGNYFNTLEGSYAIALLLPNRSLLLARNYRDLAVRKIVIQDVPFLFFASKPNYLKLPTDKIFDCIDSIPAYTWININYKDNILTTGVIDDKLTNQNKAIIVISGGLDSTTVATLACQENSEVTLLHFLYDCLAESKEKEAVAKIYEYLKIKFPSVNVKLEFFETDLFKKLGGSTITDVNLHENIAHGDEGVETCSEWVPARNTVMCAIAAAYCDRHDIGRIYLGLNLEESGSFCLPDLGHNLIRMWDGSTKKPSEIKVGDRLLSWDEKNNLIRSSFVKNVVSRKVRSYYELKVNSGRKWTKNVEVSEHSIEIKNQFGSFGTRKVEKHISKPRVEKNKVYYATGEHPFYVKGRGWIPLKDINIDDIIMHLADCKQKERFTYDNHFDGVKRIGEDNPMFGHLRSNTKKCWCSKKHELPEIESFRDTMKEVCSDPEYRQNVSIGVKNYIDNRTDEEVQNHKINTKLGIKKAMRRHKRETGYGYWNSTPEARKRLGEQTRRLISEGKINPATINDIPSPNKLELKFIEFFEQNRLDYTFVGDGQVWFTAKDGKRMNPDFIDVQSKQIIEVTSSCGWWHTKKDKRDRIKAYKQLGWSAVYLTAKDLLNVDKTLKIIYGKFAMIANGMKVINNTKITPNKLTTVYNYTVEPCHNFFLGKSGLLTHNCDNTTEFYQRMSSVTRIGTQSRPFIINPLGNLMKHEIAKLAYEIGAPIHLSWSCYYSNESECHNNPKLKDSDYCGPCLMKSRALKMSNLTISDFE